MGVRSSLWLLVLLSGSCAHPPVPPATEPQGPRHYMIPIEAKNSDWVCAETLPSVPTNFCTTVGAFRIGVMDPKVDP